MRKSFKRLLAGAASAVALAGAFTVAVPASPALAGVNGQHVELCVRNQHWDIAYFQIEGTNQDNNWVKTPVYPLTTYDTTWGRCNTVWEYWFKGYVNFNFFNSSYQFLGQRKSPYEVPVLHGAVSYTVTIF
ncbi:hypothetical protein [Actinoplanes sp. NPDC026670]|uniref:hypothetical protein n=1 Tax=Actinoplanes sp. NPDC026670 TaxID=3154700 RepID=UPI00340A6FB2